MVRRITPEQRRRLYEKFGGVCAVPDCIEMSHMPDGTPTLEIEYIFSPLRGGVRPNSTPDSDSTQDWSDNPNLILLCPLHHHLIDSNADEYPPVRLAAIRSLHLKRVELILSSVERFRMPKRSTGRRMEQAVSRWKRERQNSSEEFWQNLFTEQPELLISATNGRAFMMNSKCYVGGKAIDNQGGNVVDFIAQQDGDATLIEIKTPTAKLLGSRYRNAYPPSKELSGALAQVLNYRRSLLNELPSLQFNSPGLAVCNPSIFLLIGDKESANWSESQKRCFELYRGSLKDVQIQTYDELFGGIANLLEWTDALVDD